MLFHGLADPSRRCIIQALREGSQRVTDVVDATGACGLKGLPMCVQCMVGASVSVGPASGLRKRSTRAA